tara:strand:+ start:607 stop:1014 length:408 start_codon:yes stop_codon:yes gene_type:complete
MNHYLKFIFIIPLFFIGCSEVELEEVKEILPYVECEWIRFDSRLNSDLFCEDEHDDVFMDGTQVYRLLDATNYLNDDDFIEVDKCRWIHYYVGKNDMITSDTSTGYIEFELTRENGIKIKYLQLPANANIQYKEE